jgi:hypothetical protein
MSNESANKYAREYYRKNAKYRKKKIEERKAYAKAHKKDEAAYSRDYYHSHPDYKRYKIAYAMRYNRAHKKTTRAK